MDEKDESDEAEWECCGVEKVSLGLGEALREELAWEVDKPRGESGGVMGRLVDG